MTMPSVITWIEPDGKFLAAGNGVVHGALAVEGYVQQLQITKPANPPTGSMLLYPKTDGKFYKLDSAGVEQELGTGGGGSVGLSSSVHEEFKPANAATTVVLSQVPMSILMVARDGLVQSQSDGDYSLASSTITFTDAFNGSERVIVDYASMTVTALPPLSGNLLFSPDNTHDIGAVADTRPRDVHVAGVVYATIIGTATAVNLNLRTNGSNRFFINWDGKLLTAVDNTHDIGGDNQANRPRSLYLGSNLVMPTSGRILGDFSTTTHLSRTLFQTIAANSLTEIVAIPSGTGAGAYWEVFNASDVPNSSGLWVGIDTTRALIQTTKLGTAPYVPLAFFVGGGNRMQIQTTGEVTIAGGAQSTANAKGLYIGPISGGSGVNYGLHIATPTGANPYALVIEGGNISLPTKSLHGTYLQDGTVPTIALASGAVHGYWNTQIAPAGNTTSTTPVAMPGGFGTGLVLTGYTGGTVVVDGMVQVIPSIVGSYNVINVYVNGVDQNIRFAAYPTVAGGNVIIPIHFVWSGAAGSPAIQLYWQTGAGCTLTSNTGLYQWLTAQELRK
jgi:hypothetical protein